MVVFRIATLTVTLVVAATLAKTQSAAAATPEQSSLAFTQKFYDWFLAEDKKLSDTPQAGKMIDKRRSAFSKELLKRLDEDAAASAKSKDEIIGLDFDPILNSQDPAKHYVASHPTHRGKSFFVEVRGVTDGKKGAAADVMPELVQSGKSWVFVNFHYPASGKDQPKSDLLGVLKQLRDDRAKPRK